MTRVLLTFLMVFTTGMIFGQTTYYWIGGQSGNYTTLSNWNTQLNGLGGDRLSVASNDILIFDGTNVGGTSPTTGLVTVTATGTNSGQLKLQNGANINLGRASTGTGTITINGDGTPAPDFVVPAGCTLTLGSPVYDFNTTIIVTVNATALIGGTVYLSPLSTTVHTRSFITAAAAESVIFTSGSVCHISDSSATSGFNASVQDGVRFMSGSSCYYYTGRSPIGSSSTLQYTNFDMGSNLYFMNTNRRYDGSPAFGSTQTYTSSAWSNRKGLGNIFIRNGVIFYSDGPFDRIGDLTIDNGGQLITHSSGVTPILGNLTVNGFLDGPSGSSNQVVLGGNSPQTISGTGTIDLPNLTIANYSDVTLARSLNVLGGTDVIGKINFGATHQLTGPTDFVAKVNATATSVTGDVVAGSYRISNVVGTLTGNTGLAVTGNGLAPNSNVVGFSGSNAVILLSKPATTTLTGVTFNFFSDTATMVTANINGMDSLTGSVVVIANKSYQSGTNYIINGATSKPFGISSGSTSTRINAGSVVINAPVTVNRGINIYNQLLINGKLTLRPTDTVHIQSGAGITGTFGATKYIVTDYVTATGVQSIVQYDGMSSSKTIPIGTVSYYLPITIDPVSASNFSFAVFQGITTNGLLNGTQFTGTQRLRVVNAVWNVNRLSGSGNANLQLGWNEDLEGTTFNTLPSADIGLIRNIGSGPTGWAPPVGIGDNLLNTAVGTVSDFGSFGAGAKPQVNAFIYNDLPIKTYGDPEFNGGATSLNTTNPITYTSSNPAVATIVSGLIRINGAGTSNITASQTGDGVFPDTSSTKLLTVDKAALTIRADNKSKFELVYISKKARK